MSNFLWGVTIGFFIGCILGYIICSVIILGRRRR
jgi:hypothetical protein